MNITVSISDTITPALAKLADAAQKPLLMEAAGLAILSMTRRALVRPDLSRHRAKRFPSSPFQKFNFPAKLRCLASLDVPDKSRAVVNRISSLYGRPVGNLLEMLSEKPLYLNTKKSRNWLRTAGLQLPGARGFQSS